MNNAFVLGPFVVPFALVLSLAAAAATFAVGQHVGGESGGLVRRQLWKALVVGLVLARAAFVWEFRSSYFASPLDIVDIRDGGWSATAGFVGAWLFVLSRELQLPGAKKAMRSALMTGTVAWAAGAAVLSVRPDTGQALPALGFVTLQGAPVNLAAFVGKPMVVNLWATWCPPCVHEMPLLQQAQIDRSDVNFVFVNQGEPANLVGAWLASRQLTMRNVLLDTDRRAAAAFKERALPTTLFFDARGRPVGGRVGELSAAALDRRLRALKTGTAPP